MAQIASEHTKESPSTVSPLPSEEIEEEGDREPLDLSLSSASTKLDESAKSQFSSPTSNTDGSGGPKIPMVTSELPFPLNASSSATLLQLYQMLTCVHLWRSGTVEHHPQQQIKSDADMTSSAFLSIAPIPPLPLIPASSFPSTIPSLHCGIPMIDGLMDSEELKFSRWLI
ncbi:hypothetical protein Aperf_G00000051467 [Anoplocephala perfoliata]